MDDGATVDAFDTEEACMSDTVARYTKEAEAIAKAEAGVMQPYDLATATAKAAVSSDGNASDTDLGALPGLINTKAINEDECAIWLCLPSGFPPGCESAHKAMLKRLKKGRSALPEFSSCAVGGDDSQTNHDFTSEDQFVIKIGDRYAPGTTCRLGNSDAAEYIPGCTGVYHKTSVLQNGQQIGQTHYELIRENKPWEGTPATSN